MSDTANPSEILMTEDGHPIGEVVIASAPVAPAPPTEETVAANREELMRQAACEMTGAPDADAAVAELYPGYADSDRRRKAMELYAVEGRSIDEVAKAVDVPGRTVAMWVYNGQWDVLAKREVSARQAQSALELARMRADRRIEIAKEQFEQAKEIREKAMSRIRDDEGSLKANAEAWTAAAKVEHTLSGVSEAGTLAETAEREDGAKKDGGKQPLVVVIQGGGLPPVRRHG